MEKIGKQFKAYLLLLYRILLDHLGNCCPLCSPLLLETGSWVEAIELTQVSQTDLEQLKELFRSMSNATTTLMDYVVCRMECI